jgi:hypothetical protein
LEFLDLYARPIKFTIKGKDRYRTVCGGSVSLLILSLFLIATIAEIKSDLITKDSSNLISETFRIQKSKKASYLSDSSKSYSSSSPLNI